MGRMERYDNSNNNTRTRSRTEKNKDLYNDLGKLEKYTTLTDVSKIEAIELNSAKKNYRTREGYHQIKDYDLNIKEYVRIQKEEEYINEKKLEEEIIELEKKRRKIDYEIEKIIRDDNNWF